ncbi:hypothetical protein POM88_000972 [Heracleum sosnowskyi]|uniref:Uncharacterized protein n=1 Tax=Heracleum sosnowskyi TaxID=360622 RepID=A0AAD8JF85_9APIA|nr:hypothetical protein POM88_000972 [Heracleum sosnowskyi]
MAGEAVLSLGNLSTQYALAIGICWLTRTTLKYFLDDKINSAEILFPGVGCFLVVVSFASGVHASNATDNEAKLKTLANHKIEEIGFIFQMPRSSFKAYLSDWYGRGWASLAGLLCGFGNGLQFIGGQAAGYAAADVVQAFPLVSTFWGIILFGEYERSSGRTYMLLSSMLLMFIVAVGILKASSGQRKQFVKFK